MAEWEASALARKMIQYLDCPCEIIAPAEDGDRVWEAYKQAQKRGYKEGFTPVLVVVGETLMECIGYHANEQGEPSLEGSRQSHKTTLTEQVEADGESYLAGLLEERREEMAEDGDEWEERFGEMADGETIDVFTSIWDCESRKTCEIVLAHIPTQRPWEIFAWLPMGGWNECPDTRELMAVAKYWYECYGALPALVSGDTLEFVLERPVAEEKARRLAAEHYAYCPDRVDQGTSSYQIGELADTLRKSTLWYFWWD